MGERTYNTRSKIPVLANDLDELCVGLLTLGCCQHCCIWPLSSLSSWSVSFMSRSLPLLCGGPSRWWSKSLSWWWSVLLQHTAVIAVFFFAFVAVSLAVFLATLAAAAIDAAVEAARIVVVVDAAVEAAGVTIVVTINAGAVEAASVAVAVAVNVVAAHPASSLSMLLPLREMASSSSSSFVVGVFSPSLARVDRAITAMHKDKEGKKKERKGEEKLTSAAAVLFVISVARVRSWRFRRRRRLRGCHCSRKPSSPSSVVGVVAVAAAVGRRCRCCCCCGSWHRLRSSFVVEGLLSLTGAAITAAHKEER